MNLLPVLSLVLVLFLAACAASGGRPGDPTSTGGSAPAPLSLSSESFQPGQAVPRQYTCQGSDSSPALSWSAPPAGTRSLALVLEDPDAASGLFIHWVVYNIPPDARGLAENASKGRASSFNLPQGAVQGKNSFGRADYGGPCPPSGTHRYIFRLYALDTTIGEQGLDRQGLLRAMQGHILAQGELMGTYKKS